MVYLVVGFPRSGTSMMMRALEVGGTPAVFDPARDAEMRAHATGVPGYDPNPHGYYETDLRRVDWPACRGKVVKVIRDNLADLLPHSTYRAVYLTRNPREIRRSLPGTMSGPPSPSEFGHLADYWRTVRADVWRLRVLGAAVTVLHYPAVVADPRAAFGRLAAAGWPIDAGRAAAAVDPALYRHRGA